MSEAAKPADPERALAPDREAELARLESLLPQVLVDMCDRNLWKHYDDTLHAAAGWLLPLARAGLRCDALERELEVRLLEESEKREALEQEFEACVRVLSRLTEIDVLSTDGVMYRLTASSVAAIALAQPLAAAVLRSPEPAIPADGGA